MCRLFSIRIVQLAFFLRLYSANPSTPHSQSDPKPKASLNPSEPTTSQTHLHPNQAPASPQSCPSQFKNQLMSIITQIIRIHLSSISDNGQSILITIDIIEMFVRSVLLIALVAGCAAQLKCPEPQKGVYMSYNAISKQDTLPLMFTEINTLIPRFNDTYNNTQNSTLYKIINLHPQLYYSEHHQKETYVDQQHVNVTLGAIELAFSFSYDIKKNNEDSKTGTARGRVLVDDTAYFVKRLLVKDGYLEWDPKDISPLAVTYPIALDNSNPKLEFQDKSQLELMLNEHVGQRKIKTDILNSLNSHYTTALRDHLNKEEFIGTNNITYKYQGIEVDFDNVVKEYKLEDKDVKGLEVAYMFEPQNGAGNCTPNTMVYNQKDYGGLQEIYAISAMNDALKLALQKGLADKTLDKSWQVPSFQFYMGDLSNFIAGAADYKADEPVSISCKWDQKQEPSVISYDDHDLYATIHEICTVSYQNNPIFSVDFDLNSVVRIIGEDNSLIFQIKGANMFGQTWNVIDQKFSITNAELARYYLAECVKILNGNKCFGSGWQTIKRRFPVVKVDKKYVIVFDPSEV